MSATPPPPPPPPTPIEVQENPKGKGGGFKSHLWRSSYVGSFDLSKTSPFFSGGAYIKRNGPMASNCIRHILESVQEIKD